MLGPAAVQPAQSTRPSPTVFPCNKTPALYVSNSNPSWGITFSSRPRPTKCHDCARSHFRCPADAMGTQTARLSHHVWNRLGHRLDCAHGGSWRRTAEGQEEQARNLGKDVMIVFHGRTSLQAGGTHAGRVVHWEDPDVAVVQEESPDCEYAIPELEQDTVRAHSNFNNAAFTVTGSYPQFAYIRTLDVGAGRFYDWDDMREARRVAFLGSDAAKQLFPGRNPVGDTIYLNDFPYTVIGVMAKKKQDSSYDGWDVNKVFVPFAAMRRDFPDKPPGTNSTFDQMLVTPKSVDQHVACKHEVRVALARMHRYDPNDKEACPIWDTVQEAQASR